MATAEPIATSEGTAGPVVAWTLRLLAVAAAGIAGYLLWTAWAQHGLPAGCGAGSGCQAVLGSRWAGVFFVPVSAPALLVYVGVFVASFGITERRSPATRRRSWNVLLVLAAAMTIAAAWFIGLQLLVLRAVCPWCMADHALGLLMAGIIFWHAVRSMLTGLPAAELLVRGRGMLLAGGTGMALAVIIPICQALYEYTPHQVLRLPAGENADTGPGPHRRIAVLDGRLQPLPHETPRLGSADAPTLLVVLFDYCCPHCQTAHEYLLTARQRYPEQLGVLLLPSPLDARCNPAIRHTEDRFRHACVLARLALAVWRADPAQFAEYDSWLFASEEPRTPEEARAKAAELVTAGGLDLALRDPWIEAQIAQNVEAYAASGVDRIPILMSPGFATVVGRPESEEELLGILEADLHLQPVE